MTRSEPKYATIVADPPWPQAASGPRSKDKRAGRREWAAGTRQVLPYDRMTVEAIRSLPVEALAAADAHLYLWTTNRFVREVYGVAEAWGFTPSTLLVWAKSPMGLGPGGAYAITTEFLLLARRGKLAPRQRWDSTWFDFKRVKGKTSVVHSAKPLPFLDVIEAVSPGPYVELFSRATEPRLGWDYWGDQSLGTAQMPEAA